MKLLAFLLLSLYIFYVKSEACDKPEPDTDYCLRVCYKTNNTVCANNGICYSHFYNMCVLSNKNCHCIEHKLPVFKFISKGPCVNPTLRRCLNPPVTPPPPASSRG
nr:uncharacterized protein LOC108074245 [Drosophila kikkawai]